MKDKVRSRLVAGGDCPTGQDPQSGVELWRWDANNPTRIGHWRSVPSPVAVGNLAVLCAPKGSPAYTIELGNHGALSESAVAGESEERSLQRCRHAACLPRATLCAER